QDGASGHPIVRARRGLGILLSRRCDGGRAARLAGRIGWASLLSAAQTAMTPTDTVQREETGHRGSFYIDREGKRLAELTFSAAPDGKLVILEHTEVSESL